MRSVAISLSCLCFAIGAVTAPAPETATRSITVLLDFERPKSSVSLASIERELAKILAPMNLRVSVRRKADASDHAEFNDVVTFKMRGNCTAQPMPLGALSDERGPLAMTYSVDGELLPFGEVLCDRLNQTLSRDSRNTTSDPLASAKYQRAYGVAIARVMAHEMYHIVANTPEHSKSGVSKASLSPADLSGGALTLDVSAASVSKPR